MFKVIGKTPEGLNVISGVYQFYETFGLPLDLLCEELFKKNYVPAWDDFYMAAAKAGIGHSKIMSRIQEVISARRHPCQKIV